MSLSMHWFLIIGNKKYKKVKTKIFCKVLYRYANNPVAVKKLFFQPHRRRQCWFLFFNSFFCKNPSFIYAKISWQLKPTEMHLISSKLVIRDFRFLTSYSHFRKIYKRSWRFSHNSLEDFIFLKNQSSSLL